MTIPNGREFRGRCTTGMSAIASAMSSSCGADVSRSPANRMYPIEIQPRTDGPLVETTNAATAAAGGRAPQHQVDTRIAEAAGPQVGVGGHRQGIERGDRGSDGRTHHGSVWRKSRV